MINDKNNNDDSLKQVALFRFSLIAPLVNNCHAYKSKEEFFREVSSKSYTLDNGKKITISCNTIKSWYFKYLKNGFDALFPKTRQDLGSSRSLPAAALDRINELKTTLPHITGKAIYKKLVEEGCVNFKDTSVASLYRYLKANNLKSLPSVERKSFEMEFPNDCWQCDTSHRSSYFN